MKAIIFDKDGTLIDFDAFWLNISRQAIGEVLNICRLPENLLFQIMEAFGVHNGVTSIEGVVCKGTYAQMGTIVYDILKSHGCQIGREDMIRLVTDLYVKHSDAGQILPTTLKLKETLQTLKSRGLKLAVVTTDNLEMTLKCLKTLGVDRLFDVIYTDDGVIPTKPDPACAEDFCRRFDLQREDVLMVGDTMTDVEFAGNAGLTMIGVAKTEENKTLLQQYIEKVVPDVSYIPELI